MYTTDTLIDHRHRYIPEAQNTFYSKRTHSIVREHTPQTHVYYGHAYGPQTQIYTTEAQNTFYSKRTHSIVRHRHTHIHTTDTHIYTADTHIYIPQTHTYIYHRHTYRPQTHIHTSTAGGKERPEEAKPSHHRLPQRLRPIKKKIKKKNKRMTFAQRT